MKTIGSVAIAAEGARVMNKDAATKNAAIVFIASSGLMNERYKSSYTAIAKLCQHSIIGRKLSFLNCVIGPYSQRVGIFDDIHRNFIIIFEGLFGRWPERFHAPLFVTFFGCVIRLKINPAFINNAEELPVRVNSVSAEHAPGLEVPNLVQLIQNKILK